MASKHYLQIIDEHYEKAIKATQNPTLQSSVTGTQPPARVKVKKDNHNVVQEDTDICNNMQSGELVATGIEPVT